MATVDFKSVQQMLQKKITSGHTKCDLFLKHCDHSTTVELEIRVDKQIGPLGLLFAFQKNLDCL